MIADIGLVYPFAIAELMAMKLPRLNALHLRALERIARTQL